MKINHILNPTTKQFFNHALAGNVLEGYSDTDKIASFTINLPNGYEIDFNLINGETYEGEPSAWLDVILFDDLGNEIIALPPEHETIDGVYTFDLDSACNNLSITVEVQ